MIAPIRKLERLVAEIGFRDAMLYMLARLLESVSFGAAGLKKYYLLAQPVRRTPILPPGRKGGLEVDLVGPNDPIVGSFPRPAAVLNARFESGALCFVARSNGRFAGFLWLKTETYDEDEVRCLFVPLPKKRAAWDFDVYVEPDFRLGRAFPRLWDAAHQLLRERGVAWTMSRVSAFNPMSLASHSRLDSMRVGWATFVWFGALQVSVSSGRPSFHLALSRRSRPVLEVKAPAPDA